MRRYQLDFMLKRIIVDTPSSSILAIPGVTHKSTNSSVRLVMFSWRFYNYNKYKVVYIHYSTEINLLLK